MATTNFNETGGMEEFLGVLPANHLEPLWSQMGAMVPPTPSPSSKAHIWKYKESLPHLETAAHLVPEEQAERRVLMLVNPGLKAPFTTDTIYGGLQIVNPGEIAPAHRHIAFACRFIIDGNGFTAVEGKKMPLTRGDVIVTPTWHWHDHGNESSKPVIWLDILNLPLFTYAPVHFAEGYSKPRYPSTHCDPCEWRHPWGPVEQALNASAGPYAIYQYTNQDGQPLSPTLTVQAERLDAGAAHESQSQTSYIYHCYKGRGYIELEIPTDQKVNFEWESRDTFAVPAWTKVKCVNTSSRERAYLIAAHDSSFVDWRRGLCGSFC